MRNEGGMNDATNGCERPSDESGLNATRLVFISSIKVHKNSREDSHIFFNKNLDVFHSV